MNSGAQPASQSASRSLLPFFAITFGWSWSFWLPAVVATAGWVELPGAATSVLGVIAVFGPSVAAFGLTIRHEGRQAGLSLWQRGWSWPHGRVWLLPVLFLLPAVTLLTVGVMTLLGEPLQMEHAVPVAMMVPVFLLIYLLNALPEEYGWRGYAPDLLQARWNALLASLILGAVWGLWHLPLRFIQGSVQEVVPVWQFVAQTVVLTVLYTWVYNNTRGSVLAVALLHAVANISAATLPYWLSEVGRLAHFGVLSATALAVIAIWGPKTLTRERARGPARGEAG